MQKFQPCRILGFKQIFQQSNKQRVSDSIRPVFFYREVALP